MPRKPPAPRPEPDEEEAPPVMPPPAPGPVTFMMGAAPQQARGVTCPLFPSVSASAGIDRVRITRLDPPDGYLGTLPFTADEEMLRQTYGGRTYEVTAITGAGKMVSGGRRTITISAPPRMPGDASSGPAPAQGVDGVALRMVMENQKEREAMWQERIEWKEREAESTIKRISQEAEAAIKRREAEAKITLEQIRLEADIRRREVEDKAKRDADAQERRDEARRVADREFHAQQIAQIQANNAFMIQIMQANKPSGGAEDTLKLLMTAKELLAGPEVDPQTAMMGQVGGMLQSVATMATAPAAPAPPAPRALGPGPARPMRPAPPLPAAARPPAPAAPSVPGITPEQIAKLAALNELFEKNGLTLDQVADGLIDGELALVKNPEEDDDPEDEEDPTLENPPREAQGPDAAQDRVRGMAHPRPGDGERPGPGPVGSGPESDGGPPAPR